MHKAHLLWFQLKRKRKIADRHLGEIGDGMKAPACSRSGAINAREST